MPTSRPEPHRRLRALSNLFSSSTPLTSSSSSSTAPAPGVSSLSTVAATLKKTASNTSTSVSTDYSSSLSYSSSGGRPRLASAPTPSLSSAPPSSASCSALPPPSSSLALLRSVPPSFSGVATVSFRWTRASKHVRIHDATILLFSKPPDHDLSNATHRIPLLLCAHACPGSAWHNDLSHDPVSRPTPNVVLIDGVPFRFTFTATAVADQFVKAVNDTFVTHQRMRLIPDDEHVDDAHDGRRKQSDEEEEEEKVDDDLKAIKRDEPRQRLPLDTHVKTVSKQDAFFSPTDLRRVVAERVALQLIATTLTNTSTTSTSEPVFSSSSLASDTSQQSSFLPRLLRATQTATDLHMVFAGERPPVSLHEVLQPDQQQPYSCSSSGTDTISNSSSGTMMTTTSPKKRQVLQKRLPEDVARAIFAEAVLALGDAHRLGILMRNITPASVHLTRNGHVRLTDFTLSKHVDADALVAPGGADQADVDRVADGSRSDKTSQSSSTSSSSNSSSTSSSSSSSSDTIGDDDRATTTTTNVAVSDSKQQHPVLFRSSSFVGPRSYMAPEQLAPADYLSQARSNSTTSGHGYVYGAATDIYALGVTLYVMVTGRHPFVGAAAVANAASSGVALGSVAALKKVTHTQRQRLRFPADVALSKPLVELLSGMLAKDVDARLTLPQIRAAKWMSETEWSEVRKRADRDETVVDVAELVARTTGDCSAVIAAAVAVAEQAEKERKRSKGGMGAKVDEGVDTIESAMTEEAFLTPHGINEDDGDDDASNTTNSNDDDDDDDDDATVSKQESERTSSASSSTSSSGSSGGDRAWRRRTSSNARDKNKDNTDTATATATANNKPPTSPAPAPGPGRSGSGSGRRRSVSPTRTFSKKLGNQCPWRRFRITATRPAAVQRRATALVSNVDLVGFSFNLS